jgi:hypothetical protein
MKASEPYRVSMEAVQANPDVRQALGSGIKAGFWTSGSIDVQSGGTGSALLEIPVQGDKGTGTITARAVRNGGQWDVRLLYVTIEGTTAPIVLVNKDEQSVPSAAIGI